MAINQPINPVSVDRREETVVTQQPGYAATEQVTHDVAAERRFNWFQVTRILWSLLGLLEVLLGLRFILKLIAANPESGFAAFIYGMTNLFIAPFSLLVGTPTAGGSILEMTTMIAMIIYALACWGIVNALQIVADRPSARTVTRSVQEQTPDGVERTTRTTRSG